MRRLLVLLAGVTCLVACSGSPSSTFNVTGASVDPTYWCPGGSTDKPYDLHATVDVRNGTANAVTIQAVTAQMKLVAITGSWLEKVGDVYDAGAATYSPSTVGAGSTAKVDVAIKSSCTSNQYQYGGSSSGDYDVTMHLVTSAGAFTITAQNQHEIRGA